MAYAIAQLVTVALSFELLTENVKRFLMC